MTSHCCLWWFYLLVSIYLENRLHTIEIKNTLFSNVNAVPDIFDLET